MPTTDDLTTDLSRIAGCFVMTGLGHRQRGRQRQVCRVRLSDAVPATAAAVTAIVSGAADPRKARFPTTPALAGGRRGVPPYEALFVLRGPCSVDLHRQLANPVNEVRSQVSRSIQDFDLEVALQDLFPQDAQL